METDTRIQNIFISVLLLIGIVLAFFILRPFLFTLILALAFAVVFQPLYKKTLDVTKGKRGFAAFLATLMVFFLLFLPVTLLGIQIAQEAGGLYSSFVEGGKGSEIIQTAENFIAPYFPNTTLNITEYSEQALRWVLPNVASLFSNTAKVVMGTFVFFFSLYYMFKDGHRLRKKVISASPLSTSDDELLLNKLSIAVNSVIRGNLMIGAVQGFIASIGFLIFGVPNALLWGTVTAVSALIPGIGVALVLTPAIIFLFITSTTASWVGLLIWGVIAVGAVDNFLGPRLLGHGTELHPLLIFLSVIGGISVFGPMGILLGPLIIGFLIALFDLMHLRLKSRE